MVLGWRRAFCTSVPEDRDNSDANPSPGLVSRFGGFFSNPSTPRLRSQPVCSPSLRCRTAAAVNASVPNNSADRSPKLQCKTRDGNRFIDPSTTPRSASAFSLLRSSVRISKSRCGICLQRVKSAEGTAIFTAECGHSFHFTCLAVHVKKQALLTCPTCGSTWKEMHLLHSDKRQNSYDERKRSGKGVDGDSSSNKDARCMLKLYNDDEPLSSPAFTARFNPILESDETEEENEEFPGFRWSNLTTAEIRRNGMEASLSPEATMVSARKGSETYAVVLKIKAPPSPSRRAPIDLVAVLNVGRKITGEKLHLMKRTMRQIVSSLSTADRLSIVAFSTASKRLLPLRRMTTAGKRAARRIIDAVVALDGEATSESDSLRKAVKVISDRREKNPTSAIFLFSDNHRSSAPLVSSTSFSDSDIPIHFINLSSSIHSPHENVLVECIRRFLTVVIQDLNIQLGFSSSSAPAEISAVYSHKGKPAFLGSGSNRFRVGSFHPDEEREFLIEIKTLSTTSHQRLLSVRCWYKDPSTQQQSIYDNEVSLPIPNSRAPTRLRSLFITTRAVAESRRLAERNDVAGAHRMLASARALILQTGSGEEFVRRLEADLAELSLKLNRQIRRSHQAERADEKAEPMTPTSAWRAAERLAKVAIMRKSLNRVSDLHGFEDARF